MCAKRFLLVFGLAVLLGGVSLAAEIIYFANGTTMAIRGHEAKDGMIHVDLGDESVLAFPEYMVDRIEAAGENVRVKTNFRANQMLKGTGSGRSGSPAAEVDIQAAQEDVQERIKSYTARAREAAEAKESTPGANLAGGVANTRHPDYSMAADVRPRPADPPPTAHSIARAPQRKVIGGKIVIEQGRKKPELVMPARAFKNAPPKTPQAEPSQEGQSTPD